MFFRLNSLCEIDIDIDLQWIFFKNLDDPVPKDSQVKKERKEILERSVYLAQLDWEVWGSFILVDIHNTSINYNNILRKWWIHTENNKQRHVNWFSLSIAFSCIEYSCNELNQFQLFSTRCVWSARPRRTAWWVWITWIWIGWRKRRRWHSRVSSVLTRK